jgi:hypothetical protein
VAAHGGRRLGVGGVDEAKEGGEAGRVGDLGQPAGAEPCLAGAFRARTDAASGPAGVDARRNGTRGCGPLGIQASLKCAGRDVIRLDVERSETQSLCLRLALLRRADQLRRAGHVRALGPELLLEVLVQDRVRQLLTAPVAEDPADQRRDLDDVLHRERLWTEWLADRGVLGRHHGQGTQRGLRLGDVRVDPRHVVVRILEDLLPVGQVGRPPVDLVGEVLRRVGLVLPDALVHAGVGSAGELREVALARVTQHVDEEQAVLGRRVADPEHQLRAGVAVDVRHAELRIVLDGHPRLGAFRAGYVARRHAEGRVLEELGNLRLGDRHRGGEARVHAELVVGMGRVAAGRLERRRLRGVVEPVLTWREEVAEPAVVVSAVRLDLGGRRGSEHKHGNDYGDPANAPEHGPAPYYHAAAVRAGSGLSTPCRSSRAASSVGAV